MKKNEEIRFHHVSIVVNSDKISNLLCSLFYESKNQALHFNFESVDLALIPLGGAYLELVYPHGNERIERFLEEKGEAIHHFCFEVTDLNYWFDRCKKIGFKIFHRDDRCFFIHPSSLGGILMEFIRFVENDPMGISSLLKSKK